jgi:hypothetical protein
MDPEEPCFPNLDPEDFEMPATQRQSKSSVIGLKRDEPLVRISLNFCYN